MMKSAAKFMILLMLCLLYSLEVSKAINECPKMEQQALICFKRSLEDPFNHLSSWNVSREENCCNWEGVVCNNLTGNVHQLNLQPTESRGTYGYLGGVISPCLLKLKQLKHLDLSRNRFHVEVPSFIGSITSLEYLNLSYNGFRGKLDHSLVRLKQLKFLDLSRNNFEVAVPSFIGLLTSLEFLSLSTAGFGGKIPTTIGNLSRLHTLELGGYGFGGSGGRLYADSLEWLSGLSHLEHLNMNRVNLSRVGDWVQVIQKLPSLVELRLTSCNLVATTHHPNITSLAILDLSGNNFVSPPILKWIFKQSNLVYLDLSGTNLQGTIPSITNTTKLRHIDISNTELNSTIPDWLYFCKHLAFVSCRFCSLQGTISNSIRNLTSLTTLDLSYNQLSGKIPRHVANLCKLQTLDLSENRLQGEVSDTFGHMSDCFLGSLKFLELWGNQLSGHLTHQFGEFRNLETLDIRSNLITGQIPINLGNSSQLNAVWLNDNKFTGNLPVSIGQLSELKYLDFGNNIMTGVVTETHFANLTNLYGLSASGNHLTLKVGPNWSPPFEVSTLEFGSWNLGEGSSIPSWLETQKNTLFELDLSNAGISGNVPEWLLEMRFLNFSHNHLSGKVPDISGPETGPRLIYLNSNQFSGLLPRVGNSVEEINLSNNSFSGGISHFLCDNRNETYRLVNLHLGGNQLTGEIPDCWMKWPSLTVVNLGNNNFSGSIPTSMGFLTDMLSLNLFNNALTGQIPISMNNCTELVKMDLSSNNLVGNMPTWIGQVLTNLRFLILHSNKFNGTIPSNLCHLSSLQILDLSNNSFSGRIPSCVNNFTAMAVRRNMTDYIAGDLDFSSYYFGNFLESATITMKGREYQYGSILSLVNVIDLSKNNLSGGIPEELTTLVELKALDLSWNHLTGLIPKSIGELKQLESLDFSRNILSGEIPNSFTVMSSLSYLNLSYNNLTGRIPEGTQLRGMEASSFIGNHLCGPPLTRNCPGDSHDEREVHLPADDHKSEVEWFYVVLSLGYAVGISVFFTTFVLKKSWRNAYWRYVECKWDKLYVYYHIKLTRARA